MTRAQWKNVALFAIAFAVTLILSGCSISLYRAEWMSEAQCNRMSETEARTVQDCARYEWRETP